MPSRIIVEANKNGIHLYLKEGELAYKAAPGALTPALRQQITANKAALVELLKAHGQSLSGTPKIGRRDSQSHHVLSFSQQRLWLLDQIGGSSAQFNMAGALKLSGLLDVAVLNRAMSSILARHESLRTCFRAGPDGQPVQVIHDATPCAVNVTDLSHLMAGEQQLHVAELVAAEAGRVFDLGCDLMLRASLIKLAGNEHILLVTMHHIASDGWSMAILTKEFSALYGAYVQGLPDPLPPLAIQYADYAQWQRNWLQGKVLDEQLAYWGTQLADLPVAHSLPLDRPRPPQQTFAGASHASRIAAATARGLRALCQAEVATLFMGLHAAFSALLSRYSNETDIVVGSPIANREQAEIAPLIGFFVNTLVLRSDLSGDPAFTELLAQSKRMLRGAYAHQQVPFEQIVERLQPQRSLAHGPLFQIMLVLQNNEEGRLELPGLTLSPVEQGPAFSQYDLTLNVTESGPDLDLAWDYNTDLFDASTIARMAAQFGVLLDALVASPTLAVSRLPLLAPAERAALLALGDGGPAGAAATSLYALVAAQAQRTPDAIAIAATGVALSYRDLLQGAHGVAESLHALGAGPETRVALLTDRSADALVGLLGILAAGAAYVPLDPGHPDERLAYMLADAAVVAMVSPPALLARAEALAGPLALLSTRQQARPAPPSSSAQEQHAAYVIYTSGSTGMPKGVEITHRNALNLVHGFLARHDFAGQRVLMIPPLQFDASVGDIFPAWAVGSTLVLHPAPQELGPVELEEYCSLHGVTAIDAPAALWRRWTDGFGSVARGAALLPQLNMMMFGGESVPLELVQRFAGMTERRVLLVNHYGPTEATVCSTMLSTRDGAELGGPELPIGTPLPGVQVYVLDRHQQLVPRGVVGELCIGGAGVARGYIGAAAGSGERFMRDPFAADAAARLYRSGDMVRWNADATLQFLGRGDDQVKVRGFRIELGEVESAVCASPGVQGGIVIAARADGGESRLLAYVVVDGLGYDARDQSESAVAQRQLIIDGLRQHLGQRLPDYMMPAVFMLMDSLPLTTNGKVDRKALPAPDLSQAQAHYVAPVTEAEQQLCRIWQEILGVARVGLNDNFFQLGGHSLLATRLLVQINQHFDVTLPLKAIFQSPTLAGMAQALSLHAPGLGRPPVTAAPRDLPLALSYSQQRLWLLDQIDGGSSHYHMPGGLKLVGALNKQALDAALASIVERHESLRTVFVAGADGQPLQVIRPAPALVAALTDLSQLTGGAQQLRLDELIAVEVKRPFDLAGDLMLRAFLFKLAEDEHVLLVIMHHIASDGWSMGILVNELSALYGTAAQGLPNRLAPLALQYADYAQWQRNWLQGEVLEQQLAYWTGQLAGLPVVHSLPLDHARPSLQTFNGASINARLGAATTQALQSLCLEHGATLFMGLHAAFAVLLARYSNETDIVMGSPIANREQAEVADLIGFFIGTLVLRSDLSENPNFVQLLSQSRRTLLDAYAHQQVPFEQIVERLQPARSTSHSPLFQVMLTLQNNEQGTLDLPGLRVSPLQQELDSTKYELMLNVNEQAGGLALQWRFNVDLFAASTIERMAAHFDALLCALVEAPARSVFEAPMENGAERALLGEWNATAASFAHDKCIHELFEQQVQRTPDAVAVVFEDEQLSFDTLNTRANRLARYLVEQRQVGPDTMVGICLERSPDMVVAILAVLKAGGAYVPLDPAYPPARLAYMLDNAQLATVLTREAQQLDQAQAVCLDAAALRAQLAALPGTNVGRAGLQPHHLAYVIYTSGSSGNPKGVMVQHRSVVNLASNLQALELAPAGGKWGWIASYAFDGSVKGLTQLMLGTALAIVSDERKRDPALLDGVLDGLAVIDCTPMMVEAWFAAGMQARLPNLIIGGEAITPQLWRSLVQWQADYGKKAVNVYGPTECTVDSHSCVIAGELPHIGKLLPNTTAYVRNEAGALCGIGVAGELHLGGAGLARGYLNRTDLTAEKFVVHPCIEGERVYKTGDLVRWLADGSMAYLGRIDRQVKIRGFRIELGEIEHALASHPRVKSAAVLARPSAAGDQRLVAYAVVDGVDLHDQGDAAIAQRQGLLESMHRHVAQSLPDYMIPAAVVFLEALPLTPNGKLDHRALPEPDLALATARYVAPSTETEVALCAIWQDLLGVPQIGATDNFFLLGGHSLSATRMVARINQGFGITFPLKTLFQCENLGVLASCVDEAVTLAKNKALKLAVENSVETEW